MLKYNRFSVTLLPSQYSAAAVFKSIDRITVPRSWAMMSWVHISDAATGISLWWAVNAVHFRETVCPLCSVLLE